MWQKLRISFDRSFTKGVWKQAAWFALFFFIFFIIFSFVAMLPVLRDVDDGSTNSFERIFYLLSSKHNYRALLKGSNLFRWSFYTFVMILGSVVFGGMVSIISNMLNRHVSRYLEGNVTYKLKNHVVIVGYDIVVPELVKQILSYKGYEGSQVLILSDLPSQTVRKKVCSPLDKKIQERCFVYYGKQDSKDDLSRLNLSLARRIFIKGNTEDKNHDSANIKTLQMMVNIIKEERGKSKQHSGDTSKPASRIPVTVDFNDPATFSVFQVTDLSDDWRTHISLTPYNFHEDWARQVFVNRKCYKNGKDWVYYPALDGEGITATSDKHVHLVVIGMSQTGITMGIQAAQILHFPNSIGHPENNSRITFVDKDMEDHAKNFRHRFKHLFETEETIWTDITGNQPISETWPPEAFDGRQSRLIDVNFAFVNGDPESSEFDKLLTEWANDEHTILRIIVATDDNKRNMSTGLYLPNIIYDKNIPVFIQQETSGFLLRLLHRSDNGKYSNLYSFGTKEPTYDISERSLILAKSLNYLYCHVDPSNPEWSMESMSHWDNEKMEEAWNDAEELWQNLSIANQWSNIYCAYNITVKLRSLGITNISDCRLLTDEETDILGKVEHNRWTTEKLLMGFRKPTAQEQENIDKDDALNMTDHGPVKRKVFRDLKKRYIHGDICLYDDLYENEKDYDKLIVAHIPWIVKMYHFILQRFASDSITS